MSAVDATEARRQRGLAIAALCKIKRKRDAWIVPSQTGQGFYSVRLDAPESHAPHCDCPDFEARGEPCKHVFAVQYVVERETKADGTEKVTRTLTVTQGACAKRKTYKQDWPAYNLAQTNEKAKFQSLLSDLCGGIAEPPRKPGPGRKPVPMADMTFAAVFKVFTTVSGRRFQTDLDDACERGHISRSPRYNTVFDYFESPMLTPILRGLIEASSLPLKAVEVDFAADSSGFSTSRFVRWFDHKYGKPRREYDWVKCHLMCGVKTNIVTAVEIKGRDTADAPQFIPLLNATAKNFALHDVTADKGYTSYDNIDAVFLRGGTPYIPFRANASGARGGLYAKMFHFYNLHREEFLAHYHKRSNVETTFAMIKAKFGDSVRSKTDVAMTNEALAKILCHNLCVLIQSTYELGVNVTFWGEDEPESESKPMSADELMDAMTWI